MSDLSEIKQIILQKNYNQVCDIIRNLIKLENFAIALDCSKLLSKELIPVSTTEHMIEAKFVFAQLSKDGTHKSTALARDTILSLIDEYPDFFRKRDNSTSIDILRFAAQQCHYVGPIDTSISLYKKIIELVDSADDYFCLSELTAKNGNLNESVDYLEQAIKLDPEKFDTPENRLNIDFARNNHTPISKRKKKIGRYPSSDEFRGDLKNLIENHIATDLLNKSKFIKKDSKIFSMGSCFARNVSASLTNAGYECNHLEITEHINTTFANKFFIDWLKDDSLDNQITSRFKELLPVHWTKNNIIETIKNCDIFIITLGVATAFFDKQTGAYVMPRSTSLNTRVLAEQYINKNTSVKENVENVVHLVKFVRELSPNCTFVVTVSPVPMMASFNFESCVVADCLSKSTMRVVADELVNNSFIDNIYYWPSFEIFRWVGSNVSDFYGEDDGSSGHVSEQKVNATIAAFVGIFSNS